MNPENNSNFNKVGLATINKNSLRFLFKNRKTGFTSPFAFRMFLLAKLPAAFFAGLRLKSINLVKSVISVRYNWFNKNPFGSLYFAVLSMAAEASTGILCIEAIRRKNRKVSMLITKI